MRYKLLFRDIQEFGEKLEGRCLHDIGITWTDFEWSDLCTQEDIYLKGGFPGSKNTGGKIACIRFVWAQRSEREIIKENAKIGNTCRQGIIFLPAWENFFFFTGEFWGW